jgi:hypothetical protein
MWISPEREFHTKYTNTKITQIIHIEGDKDFVKWSGVDKHGIKHNFEGKVINKNHVLCGVTLTDIESGTVYAHRCGLFATYFIIFVIFCISFAGLLIENDLCYQTADDLENRLKHRIKIAKYWFIFWGYPLDKVNTAIRIYKSRVVWDNTYSLNIKLKSVLQSVNEIMKTN